jgi:hypothetical protein
MTLEIIIEKGEGELWGRFQKGNYLATTAGQTENEIESNLRELAVDYWNHEGKNDRSWKGFSEGQLKFKFTYDVQAFFEKHNYLTVSYIAEMAGLNASLVRQYKSVIKHQSLEQVKKIEVVIRELGKKLASVSLYGGSGS